MATMTRITVREQMRPRTSFFLHWMRALQTMFADRATTIGALQLGAVDNRCQRFTDEWRTRVGEGKLT